MSEKGTVQVDFEGEEVDVDRERPDTFLWCSKCEDVYLRGERHEHEHELEPLADEGGESKSEPERVGSWYDVTISVSYDYRFRIPAWSDHEAKDLADDWHWDASPADVHVLHTSTRELEEITTEDVPNDYDPYGGERLYEVLSDD